MNVQVFRDLEALSLKAAEVFILLSEKYIESKGRFVVAVSGGTTPKKLYEILGSDLYKSKIRWQHVHFFQVDERFVPRHHIDSNYRTLYDNFLSRISIPPENIHQIRTDVSSPAISAETYEEEIRSFFHLTPGMMPGFDLILLGIGEDGHTASLIPSVNILNERKHLAAPVKSAKVIHPRITLTLPVMNNAENIIFLVSGKNKAAIVKRVIEEGDSSLPASLVKPQKGNLIFLIDEDAGFNLEKC